MPHHPPAPTWRHPLFGADPVTLIRILASGGPLPPRTWPLAAAFLAAGLARAPLSLVERAWTAVELHRTPAPRAPVFIVGHWRSGTTHLFNLMSRDPRFVWAEPLAAGLPWDHRLLGAVLRPWIGKLLPGDRFVDAMAVEPDSPQEDEIGLASMQDVSFYHGLYCPRRFAARFRAGVFLEGVGRRRIERWQRRFEYFHRKLLAGRADGTLLIKNPVYTGRVALLRRIWPDARFIHVYRNPYDVVASTLRFHRALLSRFALQPYDDGVADNLNPETYPAMIDKLYKDVRDIADHRFIELRFEDLERAPLAQLERVYAALNLSGFSGLRDRFTQYLDTVKDYKKSTQTLDEHTIRKVDRYCGRLVEAWGYEPPAGPSPGP